MILLCKELGAPCVVSLYETGGRASTPSANGKENFVWDSRSRNRIFYIYLIVLFQLLLG